MKKLFTLIFLISASLNAEVFQIDVEDCIKHRDGIACSNVGDYYSKGQDKDYVKAAKFYTKGCDAEDKYGCFKIGAMYRDGQGISKNYIKTSTYWNKACDIGHAVSCTMLGDLYSNNDEDIKAVELYIKACDANQSTGCYNLGFFYEKGLGVKPDISKAIPLYKKACDGGQSMGCDRYKALNYK